MTRPFLPAPSLDGALLERGVTSGPQSGGADSRRPCADSTPAAGAMRPSLTGSGWHIRVHTAETGVRDKEMGGEKG